MSKKLIMFIDDDEAFLIFVRRAATKVEAVEDSIAAKDGLEAIDKLNSIIQSSDPIPKVIFVDINMPRLDGFGFLARFKELRETYPNKLSEVKPIAMLTSSDERRDKEKARELGADSYIVKPIDLAEMKTILAEALK